MKLITLILLAMTSLAQAGDIKTFSNGMTCIVDRNGILMDCSRPLTRDDTFIDMETGHIINQVDGPSAVDVTTGRIIMMTPGMPFRDDDRYEDE